MYLVNNKDEVKSYINKTKELYKSATHYCYGYIIDNDIYATDDKEPSGTAKLPILTTLMNNNYNYILVIIVRYFGGIKLGIGGLKRAYQESISECLKLVNYTEYDAKITLIFDYSQEDYVNYMVKDYIITSKLYDDKITYIVYADTELIKTLKTKTDLTIV